MKIGLSRNTPTRKRQQTVFTEAIKKHEEIREKVGILDNNAAKIERVPLSEALIFFIYTVIYFVLISQQLRIYSSHLAFDELSKSVLNQARVGDGYAAVNIFKPTFKQISNQNDVITFARSLVDPATYNISDFLLTSEMKVTHFNYLKPFTALRMTQKRVSKAASTYSAYEYKWDPSGKLTTESYGTGNRFVYSDSDEGFVQYFDLPLFNTSDDASTALNSTIADGFFDEYTRELVVDLGFYQSVNELACFFRLSFSFSAAGYASANAVNRCFNLNPYGSSAGIARGVFEGVFFALTLYYFIIESMKVFNSIRNEKLRLKLAQAVNQQQTVADLALDKGASNIRGLVNGILTHIQSLWSFLDVAIIILGLTAVGIWLDFVSKIEIMDVMRKLVIVDGNYVLSTEDDLANFHSLNALLENLRSKFESYYRVLAINGVILLLKNAKNFANQIESLKFMIQLTIRALHRILLFLGLFIVILAAFAVCCYMLFGSRVESVSSFPLAFFYASTNLMRNYRELESMKRTNYVTFWIYFACFSFFVCFIMVNLFLIYIITEYRSFTRHKAMEEKLRLRISKNEETPHLLSRLQGIFHEKIYMRFLRWFRKKRYERIRKEEDYLQVEAERDLLLGGNSFDFNMDISATLQENEKKHQRFTNDYLQEKIRDKSNLKLVRVFWSSFFVIVSVVGCLVITERRHDILQTFDMRTGMQEAIPGLRLLDSDKGVAVNLTSIPQLKQWLLVDLPSAASKKNFTYGDDTSTPGTTISGTFIGDYYFVAFGKVTLNIRRKSPQIVDDIPLNQLNNISLPFTFDWDGSAAAPDEFVGDIASQDGARRYSYDYNYRSYHMNIDFDNYSDAMQNLTDDGLIDSSLNSLSIEIPLFNVVKRVSLYFRLLVTVDNVGNMASSLTFNAINTPLTSRNSARDHIAAVIQLLIFVVFFLYFLRIFKTLSIQNEVYSQWYEIYIYYFPAIYKHKRSQKKPEILRRFEYLFSYQAVCRIVLIVLFFVDIILQIVNIAEETPLRETLENVLSAAEISSQDIAITETQDSFLSALAKVAGLKWHLRLCDSFIILFLTLDLLCCYSLNSYLNFISVTLKRIIKQLLFMILVMVFIYFCFAYFLVMTLGETDRDFTNLFNGFRTLFGVYYGISNLQIDEVRKHQDAYKIVFFFYPFLIMTKFVITNIFVTIFYDSFIITKRSAPSQEKHSLTIREFFKLTWHLVCRRRKRQLGETQEITRDFRELVNPNTVMDRFQGRLDQAKGALDVVLWSDQCARDIMQEYETRKKIRRKAKQTISMRLQETESEFIKNNFKALPLRARLSEYQLRELYWSYFRISQRRLMKFYASVNKHVINSQSRVRVVHLDDLKNQAIEKLRIYIDDLEKRVANNFYDIEKIKKVFRKHKMVGVDDPEFLHEERKHEEEHQIHYSHYDSGDRVSTDEPLFPFNNREPLSSAHSYKESPRMSRFREYAQDRSHSHSEDDLR